MKFARGQTAEHKMTKEGRLSRGKENYDRGRFLDNSETIAYAETLKDKPKEDKPKDSNFNKTKGAK